MPGNIDGLVEDDPSGRLPAAGVRRRALVRHVVIRFRQEAEQRDVLQLRRLPCTRRTRLLSHRFETATSLTSVHDLAEQRRQGPQLRVRRVANLSIKHWT